MPTATGLDPDDETVTSGPSSANTPVATAGPALSIVKSALLDDINANGLADAGETISYSFVVTNTGNVSIADAAVNDEKVTGICPSVVSLAPGESTAFTADAYTVTPTDVVDGEVTNTATAVAIEAGGSEVISEKSTVVTKTGATPVPVPTTPPSTGVDAIPPASPPAVSIATPAGLASTGSDPIPTALVGAILALLGASAVVASGRSRRKGMNGIARQS